MQFAILGPPEASIDGRRVALGGPQLRALFALLLLEANRVVSAERLVDELWDGESPRAARRLLQGCVVRLRRALQAADGRQPLVTRAPGYLLEVRPGELDLERFDELTSAADGKLRDGSVAALEAAAALLREALGLWRGPALDGVTTAACETHARRLDERRQATLETRIDVDLWLGCCAELVGELQALTRAYPLRERSWAQLMLALYGADRQADALAAYRQLRATLVEQLGVEPNAMLVELERAILTGGNALEVYRNARGTSLVEATPVEVAPVEVAPPAQAAPAAPNAAAAPPAPPAPPGSPAPSQLPAGVAGFTGRAAHLDRLDACLAGTGAVVINAIAGTAGVGKTALAVHWAHRVRGHFPDGQLYVNLRGYASVSPMRPLDALSGFLQALGVPAEQIPVDLERAAALYRTMLADRRVLVVLDNAATAEQVRPLLPGGAGCLVLVTSRDRLGGLVARDGAERITLDVLDPDEAELLLTRILGAERVAAEPEAVADLVRACARLPLALRIAAANLTGYPARSIASFVADLVEGNRLAALRVDDDEDTAVRAAFDLSYQALGPSARRLFRGLGLVPGPDFTVAVAAALLDATPAEAATALRNLAQAHLVGEAGPGRYTFHDLLRVYATERAHADEPAPQVGATVRRLYDWYLASVDNAVRLLHPEFTRLPVPAASAQAAGFDDHAEAVAWLDAERANLVVAIEHAAANGPAGAAWRLADALRGYFFQGTHFADWLAAACAAHAAAEAEGDPLGRAAAHLTMANVRRYAGRLSQAVEHYDRALSFSRQAGWREGESATLGGLAGTYWDLGRLHESVDLLRRVLVLNRRLDRPGSQAQNLGNLGGVCVDLGQLPQAAEYFMDAQAMYRKAGSRNGEAITSARFGMIDLVRGRLDRAAEHLADARALFHELGNRRSEAESLRFLAEVHRDAGRYAEAGDCVHAALTMARDNGDSVNEAFCLNTLAAIELVRGRHADAVAHHRVALRLARDSENRGPELTAMLGLAVADRQAGRLDDAGAGLDRVLDLTRTCGYRVLEGMARTARADLDLRLGEPARAGRHAREALAIHRETGYRLGEAHTLLVLGHIEQHLGDPDTARRHWQEALDLFTDIGAPEADRARRLLSELKWVALARPHLS